MQALSLSAEPCCICQVLNLLSVVGTGKAGGDRHPKIHNNVLIGASATVLGNIIVGKGAQVAAGSMVLKDVPPRTMVAGSPAKVVGCVQGTVKPVCTDTMYLNTRRIRCSEGTAMYCPMDRCCWQTCHCDLRAVVAGVAIKVDCTSHVPPPPPPPPPILISFPLQRLLDPSAQVTASILSFERIFYMQHDYRLTPPWLGAGFKG